jgi:hypothetical protein
VGTERPPDVGEADAEALERTLRGVVAIDGVLEVADALVGPVDQRDIRGYLVLPSWGYGHADEEPLARRDTQSNTTLIGARSADKRPRPV